MWNYIRLWQKNYLLFYIQSFLSSPWPPKSVFCLLICLQCLWRGSITFMLMGHMSSVKISCIFLICLFPSLLPFHSLSHLRCHSVRSSSWNTNPLPSIRIMLVIQSWLRGAGIPHELSMWYRKKCRLVSHVRPWLKICLIFTIYYFLIIPLAATTVLKVYFILSHFGCLWTWLQYSHVQRVIL